MISLVINGKRHNVDVPGETPLLWALRDELGSTGHHPRWALAYKFESPQARTVVEDIFIQVGRTGRVTPVARVRPAAVGGTTVTYITLHNRDYIETLVQRDVRSLENRALGQAELAATTLLAALLHPVAALDFANVG